MQISIATRVSLACATVLLVSLLLLGAGLAVGNGIRHANAHVEQLARALQAQDLHDAAQRELRLAMGDATRQSEKGIAVDPALWSRLSSRIDAFDALSRSAAMLPPGSAAREVDRAVAEVRAAALGFVLSSREMIAAARRDPADINASMPGFLSTLRRLETARNDAREALIHEIAVGVRRNDAESRRDILRVLGGGVLIVLVVFAMSIWLRKRLLSPIVAIATRLREFNAGDAKGTIPGLDRRDELGDLARGLAEYRAAVEKRRAAERKADFLAHHDVLTGLANRLLFENRLAHELNRSARTGDSIAVFAIDLDHFKAINDRHGHAGGDRALKRVAELLTRCVRRDDLVARLGGDEFAIIQVAPRQPQAAEALLSRLLAAAAETSGEEIEIRLSVGVAISAAAQDPEELHNLADVALYQAKAEGRNTGRFFDETLEEKERLRLHLARDMESAIADGQLRVVFQPIADAGSLRILGYEALLRWHHPVRGDIPPDTFIPIAESSGLIAEISLWAASQSFAVAAHWDPALFLSLNLSPAQFRKPSMAADLIATAAKHGLPVDRLEFEVTESATWLGNHRAEVLQGLRLLQTNGAKIVMDDFGTGHSSLSNLKDFQFNKLKVDRSFVAALLDDKSSLSIVKATVGLGKSLGLTIVAEGVETERQLAELRRWGCDQIQGYLIGRPGEPPAARFPALAGTAVCD